MKRNFLEKIGVLVVKKDMVKGLKGRVYSGHVSGKKVGVGCRIGWGQGWSWNGRGKIE